MVSISLSLDGKSVSQSLGKSVAPFVSMVVKLNQSSHSREVEEEESRGQ